MLGKMFVHEMKQSWRVPVIMSVVAAVLTVISRIITAFMETSAFRYEAPSVVRAMMGLFLLFYFIFMVVTSFLVYLLIPVRFYRESFSNIGYLTHCLPVEKSVIIWAHTLTGVIWLLMYMVIDIVCMDLVVFTDENVVIEIIQLLFGPVFREIRFIIEQVGTPAVICIVLLALSMIHAPFHMVLNSFCAVSLGQVFRKHRVAGAVGMFYLISFATGMINAVFFTTFVFLTDMINRYDTPRRMAWYFVVIIAIGLLLSLIESIVFFVISLRRMSKRLNLE